MLGRSIRSIAVFCGSNFGGSSEFADAAWALGRTLGEARITLIYGGTTKGLMGIVADAVLESGGVVHGVITENLHQRGQSHSLLTTHEITATLRSRKQRMIELADAFVALPGGFGTLEELMEVLTMNQLFEIDKPVGVLNTADFFAKFLDFIDHMIDMRFLPEPHRRSIVVDDNPTALVGKLHSYERVEVPKWL
jgi:uncharacterized protein (TIGR00730 family)